MTWFAEERLWYKNDKDVGWSFWRRLPRAILCRYGFELYILPPSARPDQRPWYSFGKLIGLKEKAHDEPERGDDRTGHGLSRPEA